RRVALLLALADVRAVQHVHPLRQGRHHAVLDAVVDHLDEVARAVGAAVQPALLGGAGLTGAAGRARRGVHARREGAEYRRHVGYRVVVAADHEAVAAVEPPDAAPPPP